MPAPATGDRPADPLLHQRQLCERARNAHLRWLVEQLGIDCVLDVGANRGQFAAGLRAQGYHGRVVSFEPAAGPRAELEQRARDSPPWDVVPLALGDADGVAELNAVDDESELGSLLPASAFGREWKPVMGAPRTEQVRVRRLDGLWDDVVGDAARVLLKLDTQGFDLAAFRGAGERVRGTQAPVLALLSEVSCVPIYESMPSMAEQLAAYTDAGLALAGLYPVSFDRRSLRVIELDAILVRRA